MHGGELFAEVVCVLGLTVAGGWLIFAMARVRDDAREAGTWQTPWGEVVEVPDAAKVAGGVAEGRSAGLAQGHRIAPHSEDAM